MEASIRVDAAQRTAVAIPPPTLEPFMRIFAAAARILLALGLCACGVNPVTGKKEIQFVFEAQELKIGEQHYAPVPLADIQVTPVLVDGAGRVMRQGSSVRLNNALKPGEQSAAHSGIGSIPQEQLPYLRFRIDSARVAE